MELIAVDTAWLEEHGQDALTVIVDVRPPFFFTQGHIPAAVNLPESYLWSPEGDVPVGDEFARRLGDLGITRDSHVVAYDSGGSASAARLFWLLMLHRHPRASVLDGGVTRWRHEGRDWEYTASDTPPRARYDIGDRDDDVLVDLSNVESALDAPDTVILDVRSPAEYLGLQATARRDGHMPGAINIDWTNNLYRDGDGISRLRPDGELRTLYESAGVTPDKHVIVHCATAHRASETFMVLKKLDYPDVAMYSPGWHEWGNRPDTPIVTE